MTSPIHPIVQEKLPELQRLCRRHHVQRLDLIGSAANGTFNSARSDLDFVLEYLPYAKEHYPDVYFDLRAGLEALFGRKVDIVMVNAVRNPIFRQEIDETRVSLYAA